MFKANVDVLVTQENCSLRYLGNEFVLDRESSEKLLHLKNAYDAGQDIDVDGAGRLLKALDKHRLINAEAKTRLGLRNSTTMAGMEFYELHRRYCLHWLEPVNEHPFWERVANGEASASEIYGFALEKYHYIEGAHEHMAIAAANATPELQKHLANHFFEEYTHGDIYRAGLRKHFANEEILQSLPLPSTRSLLNFLNELAATNSFAYYAANELLQMTENVADEAVDDDSKAVDQWYQALVENYPFAESLVRSFKDHTKLDQKLGHKDVFLEMCEDVGVLTEQQVNQALMAAKGAAEQLLIFLDGVEAFYPNRVHPIRRPETLLQD